MSQEVTDALDRQVGRTVRLRIARVLTLAGKDRGDAVAPAVLDRGQDPRLVVHQDVVLRRIASLDVVQRRFLVDIDQHVAVHGLPDAGAFDLARLEDHVAVGEDDRRAPRAEPFQDVERSRIEAIGERVVDQVRRHRHEVQVLRVLGPVALERAEVVAIAELDEERLENRPVPLTTRGAELPLEMALEVVLNPVVVQQRVVHVDQEDDGGGGHDAAAREASGRGISISPNRADAWVRSRNDGKADADSMSSVTRHRQLSSAVPGWFIRASLPRLRTSCNGQWRARRPTTTPAPTRRQSRPRWCRARAAGSATDCRARRRGGPRTSHGSSDCREYPYTRWCWGHSSWADRGCRHGHRTRTGERGSRGDERRHGAPPHPAL